MATIVIDATNPSTTNNINVLKSALDKILESARENAPVNIAPDEYVLLNEIRFAVATGIPSANVVTAVTMTY